MFEEKIIQISGKRALTNRGRLFEEWTGTNGMPYWVEVKPPEFVDKSGLSAIPKGTTTFVESVSTQEKFREANTIDDLLN